MVWRNLSVYARKKNIWYLAPQFFYGAGSYCPPPVNPL